VQARRRPGHPRHRHRCPAGLGQQLSTRSRRRPVQAFHRRGRRPLPHRCRARQAGHLRQPLPPASCHDHRRRPWARWRPAPNPAATSTR
jgi:hypothetical protein